MGLKRNIELSAQMNSTGYGICVKINGISFDGHSNCAGGWRKIVLDIYSKLQAVYGERALFERYVEYQDILNTMIAAGEIVENMDRLYSRSCCEPEAKHDRKSVDCARDCQL